MCGGGRAGGSGVVLRLVTLQPGSAGQVEMRIRPRRTRASTCASTRSFALNLDVDSSHARAHAARMHAEMPQGEASTQRGCVSLPIQIPGPGGCLRGCARSRTLLDH